MDRSSVAVVAALVLAGCGGSTSAETLPGRVGDAAEERSCARATSAPGFRACWSPGPERRPSTIERRSGDRWTVLARSPTRPVAGVWHGRWTRLFLSPDGQTLLAQWSGECEIPTAFFLRARGGRLRTVTGEPYADAPESLATGWSHDGRAKVELWEGLCGKGSPRPGAYLIDPATGDATFVRPLNRRSS